MKKLILISFVLLSIMSYGQTKVNFSSFDAWKQNSTSKKMEFIKTIYDSGYVELNNGESTVIIYSEKRNQKELFQFTPFRKVDGGHYLGFGKVDTKQMMTFIPEDKLLLLKVNGIVVMIFQLKDYDVTNIKNELDNTTDEEMITWDNCATKGERIFLEVSRNYPNAYKSILIFVNYKVSKQDALPSEDYVTQEINRQCFGFYMIRNYVDLFGIDAYQEKIGKFSQNHGVFIDGEFYIDDYSLGYATLRN